MTDDQLKYYLIEDSYSILMSIDGAVSNKYIRANGLQRLPMAERRRVAAMFFVVLENAKYEEGPTLPDFTLLNCPNLENLASALAFINVQIVNHEVRYMDAEEKSVSVSAAITFLLFVMSNIPVRIMAGRKGLETTTSLYAARHLIIDQFKLSGDNMMEEIELISLVQPIPVPSSSKYFKIPLFDEKQYGSMVTSLHLQMLLLPITFISVNLLNLYLHMARRQL
jgi:hypothetical protein